MAANRARLGPVGFGCCGIFKLGDSPAFSIVLRRHRGWLGGEVHRLHRCFGLELSLSDQFLYRAEAQLDWFLYPPSCRAASTHLVQLQVSMPLLRTTMLPFKKLGPGLFCKRSVRRPPRRVK
jgi:hypothetical protein